MDSEWEKFVKRYVWNDERTPYFTRVANLTRRQAHYELFGYALFVGVLSGVLSLASLSTELAHGDHAWVSLYAFSVCCAAILLGATRHAWAAFWCGGAPLATLGYFALYGFQPGLETPDKILICALLVGWSFYARRALAIARAWPDLSGPAEPD